jgi:hypothetical protein
MRKTLVFTISLMLTFSQLIAAAPELRGDHPDSYVVVKGDTLWGISAKFLKNPWYWPEIWQVNPQIENPHLIYPGDMLALIYVDGQPRLVMAQRGDMAGTYKLSPKKRISELASAIPAIPLEAIAPFLSNGRIVTEEELEAAPYVLLGKHGNLIVGAGDNVYGRGEAVIDASYGIFRKGQIYTDPDSGEFLGIEARAIATGRTTEKQGDIVTVSIAKSSEEIRQGDRLLEQEDREINTTFFPANPDNEIRGKIIAVLDGVNQIGQYDVVTINQGTREGIKEGTVLAVHRKGEQVRDPYTKEILQLPTGRAGIMMVFRAFEKLSYALILSAERPLSVLDEVRNP